MGIPSRGLWIVTGNTLTPPGSHPVSLGDSAPGDTHAIGVIADRMIVHGDNPYSYLLACGGSASLRDVLLAGRIDPDSAIKWHRVGVQGRRVDYDEHSA